MALRPRFGSEDFLKSDKIYYVEVRFNAFGCLSQYNPDCTEAARRSRAICMNSDPSKGAALWDDGEKLRRGLLSKDSNERSLAVTVLKLNPHNSELLFSFQNQARSEQDVASWSRFTLLKSEVVAGLPQNGAEEDTLADYALDKESPLDLSERAAIAEHLALAKSPKAAAVVEFVSQFPSITGADAECMERARLVLANPLN